MQVMLMLMRELHLNHESRRGDLCFVLLLFLKLSNKLKLLRDGNSNVVDAGTW